MNIPATVNCAWTDLLWTKLIHLFFKKHTGREITINMSHVARFEPFSITLNQRLEVPAYCKGCDGGPLHSCSSPQLAPCLVMCCSTHLGVWQVLVTMSSSTHYGEGWFVTPRTCSLVWESGGYGVLHHIPWSRRGLVSELQYTPWSLEMAGWSVPQHTQASRWPTALWSEELLCARGRQVQWNGLFSSCLTSLASFLNMGQVDGPMAHSNWASTHLLRQPHST